MAIKFLNDGAFISTIAVQGSGDSYFTGSVGIGTTSPDAKLQVETTGISNTAIFENSGQSFSYTAIKVGEALGNRANLTFVVGDNLAATDLIGEIGCLITSDGGALEGAMSFKTNSGDTLTERMVISSAGALRFNAYGAGTLITDASGNITVSSGGGAGGPYLPLAGGTMTGNIIFNTGGDSSIKHTGSGSLVIRNEVDNQNVSLQADNGSGGNATYVFLDGSTGEVKLNHYGASKLATKSTGIAVTGEGIFTGNVGIGATTPAEKLQVNGRVYIEQQGTNWNETTPGQARGALHFDPVGDGTNNTGNAITFGASDASSGTTANAGIYTRSDDSYGTKMYFATTDSYATGSKTAMMIDSTGVTSFTSTPIVLTRTAGDNTTRAASTAFVTEALGSLTPGTNNFVASGSILEGKVVGLKSDGTVEVISSTGSPAQLGNATFSSSQPSVTSTAYDSTNNRIVICYQDGNSGQGTAVVGTVSGTTITFGTPVVFSSFIRNYLKVTSSDNGNNKVVICYIDSNNSRYGTAIVGTVSGTTISFGTAAVFNSARTFSVTSCHIDDSTPGDRVVISYTDLTGGVFGAGKLAVGVVSGTGIFFGTPVVFNSAQTDNISLVWDASSQKAVIFYYQPNSNSSTYIVASVGGSTISLGSASNWSGSISNLASVYDSTNNKIVLFYQDNSNSTFLGTFKVASLSGTTLTFGTSVLLSNEQQGQSYRSLTFDSANNKVIAFYKDQKNSNFGTAVTCTVSGTTISLENPVVFNSAITNVISSAFDTTNNKLIIAYSEQGPNIGEATVYKINTVVTNANSTIGINSESALDTETCNITTIGGVNSNQSGLTIGELYYVQYDGSITTTPDTTNPYKTLGKAISTSKILVQNQE